MPVGQPAGIFYEVNALKLTPFTFASAVLASFALIAPLGYHVPRLISAQSTVLVQVGLFLILAIIIAVGSFVVHLYNRGKKQ